MFRIIDKRGSGKTSRLMLIAKEYENTLFVCGNPKAMEQKAHAYGITGIEFISYYDFLDVNKWRGTERRNVVIDEIEPFIRHLNPCLDLIGYSISEDDL